MIDTDDANLDARELQARKKIQTWTTKAKNDFHFFLFSCCKTIDQHDKVQPIKPFPKYPYLEELARRIPLDNRIIVPKSRQMLITWICCCYILWDCMWNVGRFWFIVSKKEEDANELVDRLKFVYQHLPTFMTDYIPTRDVYCKLIFTENKSKIVGVSQDADALRTYVASGIFSDEMAFQPYAKKSYASYIPTLENGQLICVSTPNGKEFFYKIMADKAGGEDSEKKDGEK